MPGAPPTLLRGKLAGLPPGPAALLPRYMPQQRHMERQVRTRFLRKRLWKWQRNAGNQVLDLLHSLHSKSHYSTIYQ